MFFEEWNKKGLNNLIYLSKFLNNEEEVICSYENENPQQIVDVLVNLDINYLLEKINHSLDVFDGADVPQFSNFNDGIIKTIELLEIYKDGLTYEKLGHSLRGNISKLAKTKYGENHGKLANFYHLTNLSKSKPTIVKNVKFGTYFIGLTEGVRSKCIKVLSLTIPFFRYLICMAKTEVFNYYDATNFLKKKTQDRRKSNVKKIITLILDNTNYQSLLDQIEWRDYR